MQRCKDLVIPPAWKDVWITPYPNGHLQAVGTDDAGRKQYLYHPQWRSSRDAAKFDRILGAWWDRLVPRDGNEVVRRSAERYAARVTSLA